MQIGSNNFYNIGSNYTIKLNDKQILVVEENPLEKVIKDAKKVSHEKEQEEKKVKETKENSSPDKLSTDEKRLMNDLSSRDSEVRRHESAHQAAGGGLTGTASYTYQQGPDGKMYAIGGAVSIMMPSGSTPEETIKNSRQLIAAAMATGDPSSQDFAVAASARMMAMKAQQKESQGKETYMNEVSSLNTNSKDENTDSLRVDISA